jgi:hypothetical protein
MKSGYLLHILAPGRHSQGVLQIKIIQVQHAKLGTASCAIPSVVLGLYSFDLKVAPWCENMWDFDTYNELYFIKCICWLMYIDYLRAFDV